MPGKLVGIERDVGELATVADEELLMRYRDQADMGAFELLVQRYRKPIYRFLLHYLHNTALAEDVLQATFLRLHQKRQAFNPGLRLRPWLYSIATHLAVDAIRAEGRRHAVSLDAAPIGSEREASSLLDVLQAASPSPVEQFEARERAEWVHRAVASLPDQLRIVVLLIYFQGLRFDEAAEALRLPLGTVKSRIHKALSILNAAWTKELS